MKVEFLTPLRVEKNNGDWRVLDNFVYSVDGTIAFVEAGYLTDFASVPRLPFTYAVAGNVSHKAPLIHDYLYGQQENRKWADQVFLAALEAEGVPNWKRWLMYAAVRVFGNSAYAAKTEPVEVPPP